MYTNYFFFCVIFLLHLLNAFVYFDTFEGGDFSAGQVLVGSKDEQERLFIEAERDYEQRMSKLADAQLAADGKNEQDMDREMRVQEMEDAINRAMDARRAAQRSGEFKSTGMLTIRVVIIVFVILMG